MNRLEVRASKVTVVSSILLGLICVPLGTASLLMGLSKGFAAVPTGLGLSMFGLFGFVVWLARRGHRMSVRYFSDEGLTRNDGRSFAWAELSRVADRIRIDRGRKRIWRTEIQFRDGESAWLIPPKVINYQEVREFVRNLPCEHTEA
jgi:hypothetical protein